MKLYEIGSFESQCDYEVKGDHTVCSGAPHRARTERAKQVQSLWVLMGLRCVLIIYRGCYWGEPERAPPRAVQRLRCHNIYMENMCIAH